MTTKTEKTKQSALEISIKDIKNSGMKLTEAMSRVETLKDYSNTLMFAFHSDSNRVVLLDLMEKFCGHIFEEMNVLYGELNDIAYPLLECDNKRELDAYRKGKG